MRYANYILQTLLNGTAFPGNGSNQGEVESPLAGEFRLQSDFELSRDPRSVLRISSVALCLTQPTALPANGNPSLVRASYPTAVEGFEHICADNQQLMASKFRAAMSKLAIVGQSRYLLTDCSG